MCVGSLVHNEEKAISLCHNNDFKRGEGEPSSTFGFLHDTCVCFGLDDAAAAADAFNFFFYFYFFFFFFDEDVFGFA